MATIPKKRMNRWYADIRIGRGIDVRVSRDLPRLVDVYSKGVGSAERAQVVHRSVLP
jgi:hypothetical protein